MHRMKLIKLTPFHSWISFITPACLNRKCKGLNKLRGSAGDVRRPRSGLRNEKNGKIIERID
jgi:hypothetical protein